MVKGWVDTRFSRARKNCWAYHAFRGVSNAHIRVNLAFVFVYVFSSLLNIWHNAYHPKWGLGAVFRRRLLAQIFSANLRNGLINPYISALNLVNFLLELLWLPYWCLYSWIFLGGRKHNFLRNNSSTYLKVVC